MLDTVLPKLLPSDLKKFHAFVTNPDIKLLTEVILPLKIFLMPPHIPENRLLIPAPNPPTALNILPMNIMLM